MRTIYTHTKFNKVYQAVAINEIPGSIGNGKFAAGQTVCLAIAVTKYNLDAMVAAKLRQLRRSFGGDGVMFEGEIVDLTAEKFEQDILAYINNYVVYAVSEDGRSDYSCDFEEAKLIFRLTGNICTSITPEETVETCVTMHNKRVR